LGLPEREVTFQLLATAVDYCPATVPYVVTVQAVPERCDPLLIPNIATPGSATANATFALKGITPGTATVKIYNRWGLEVFSSTSYTNNWPTTDTPPGLYFYALDAPTRGLAGRKGWVEVTKK
jgi:hypothetical protein